MNIIAIKIVNEAIDEVNADQNDSGQIGKLPDTVILGSDSNVDSLALVRLLLAIERLVEEQIGRTISVVDESAFEMEQSPFSTVGTLIRHVESLLG